MNQTKKAATRRWSAQGSPPKRGGKLNEVRVYPPALQAAMVALKGTLSMAVFITDRAKGGLKTAGMYPRGYSNQSLMRTLVRAALNCRRIVEDQFKMSQTRFVHPTGRVLA